MDLPNAALSRRDFLQTSLAASAALASGAAARAWPGLSLRSPGEQSTLTAPPGLRRLSPGHASADVHEQILEEAARLQALRRTRFAAVQSKAQLSALQADLRQKFLALLDGLPEAAGPPPAKVIGRIEADDYTIDKVAYESLPGYFVSALLYLPKKRDG